MLTTRVTFICDNICDNKLCKHEGGDTIMSSAAWDSRVPSLEPVEKGVCPKCGFKTYRQKTIEDFLNTAELSSICTLGMVDFPMADFLKTVSKEMINHPNWRYGQALFNCLQSEYPSIANSIRGKDHDPYYVKNSETTAINEFLSFLAEQKVPGPNSLTTAVTEAYDGDV